MIKNVPAKVTTATNKPGIKALIIITPHPGRKPEDIIPQGAGIGKEQERHGAI